MSRKKPIILESIFREGLQETGANLSPDEYIEIGEELINLGIDSLETHCVDKYTEKISRKMIDVFGEHVVILHNMSHKSSVDRFKTVGKSSAMYLGISPDFLSDLNLDKSSALTRIKEDISYARKENLRVVKYVFEDATRQPDLEFLKRATEVARDAGAESICYADTVGIRPPWEYAKLLKKMKEETGVRTVTHNHNDFGWALAASLMAYHVGAADILSCSIMGVGERSGITPTEQLLVILRQLYGFPYETENLSKVIEHVSRSIGIKLKAHDPQGPESFTHGSGIHLERVRKNPKMYEPYPPEMVGRKGKSRISFLIGQGGIKHVLKEEYDLPRLVSEEEAITIRDDVREYGQKYVSDLTRLEFEAITAKVLAMDPLKLLALRKMPSTIRAYVHITVDPSYDTQIAKTIRRVIKEADAVDITFGKSDIIVSLTTDSIAKIDEYTNIVRSMEGVRSTKTDVVARILK